MRPARRNLGAKKRSFELINFVGISARPTIALAFLEPFQSCPNTFGCGNQWWSRGHKARGQGHKKNPRPRTAFPRTDTLETKNRNARGQGPRTQAQVLSKKKKKKKRSSQKFFKRSPRKNVFQKIFQPLHKILTIQKIVLSSSRGKANFRGLEASRPRPRTSKCVLEAKDVLKDSTSGGNNIKVLNVVIT